MEERWSTATPNALVKSWIWEVNTDGWMDWGAETRNARFILLRDLVSMHLT